MIYTDDLPCMKCPVLAVCVGQRITDCSLLLDFLNKYQRIAKFPMWPNMLTNVRETLRGNWCVVGVNNRITYIEKDRLHQSSSNNELQYHNYEYDKWKRGR